MILQTEMMLQTGEKEVARMSLGNIPLMCILHCGGLFHIQPVYVARNCNLSHCI
jgi:hypothetical protein